MNDNVKELEDRYPECRHAVRVAETLARESPNFRARNILFAMMGQGMQELVDVAILGLKSSIAVTEGDFDPVVVERRALAIQAIEEMKHPQFLEYYKESAKRPANDLPMPELVFTAVKCAFRKPEVADRVPLRVFNLTVGYNIGRVVQKFDLPMPDVHAALTMIGVMLNSEEIVELIWGR
jgi:hypothetical protein